MCVPERENIFVSRNIDIKAKGNPLKAIIFEERHRMKAKHGP